MKKSKVLIDLTGAMGDHLIDKDLRNGLSAATRSGNYLWVAGDEQISIQRLEKTEEGWGNCTTFHLGDYIELVSQIDEADVEGMDFDGRYLWITGSHSLKRCNISKKTDDPEKAVRKLTKVSMDPNRVLLLRIPCQPNEKGEYVLSKSCPDPEDPTKTLTAAKLKHGKKKSQLSKALKNDEHLKDYMKIPGKDNGFDIEGMAAIGERVFLGLRGPVLRGWAIVLEIQTELDENHELVLKEIGRNGLKYNKFFMQLHGMGVREMATDGNDLLILAGPTMDLDGTMAIYRWKNAATHDEKPLITRQELEEIATIPHKSNTHGINKAEGMVLLEDRGLLVLYDSPGKERLMGEHAVMADVFHL
ncbi:DUF3616 domain-containing protein [Cesiribacter sp. SM1]|uniref:DUF3616 domain-containing protein n=1 Tax=Cesiribacter sp. SM1 TaxID=2861196 RepID=UPI001CD6A3E4|nr:DUF3616 domain-containing protein [Cesiribacter sp. SM1]